MDLVFGVLLIALLVYAGFLQLMRHQRRLLIHRERIAAIEKGIELPPVEEEARRSSWNVQRILLLAGLVWISIGIGVWAVLASVVTDPSPWTAEFPRGLQYIGIAPIAIGVSHLIVYFVDRRQ